MNDNVPRDMTNTAAELFSRLELDPWRNEVPFADDFGQWHDRVISAGDPVVVGQVLNEWLQRHQPCLFGRLAAKANAITYCILNEQELLQSDESILAKIQERRLAWSRDAYYGRSSAFVIVFVSDRIARAT